ncbi:TPA: NinE family protein [Raoultella ornithinolytica]|uniref:NinE family protein n=1 Tax=Raoultella ornithinolytica TaxID=54291 RepID=UPI0005E607B8|nr:NinE family protein [Raoultella ornithinolytica]KJG48556.1 prophage protein NinE [Raoultella planticola]MCF6685213.1 NinE family protein [Raoultella ornithinolytica]HEQ3497183.1 NinE family protein [Raoultella ornithinolytica]
MSSQLAKVMDRGIFRVPARRRKRKAEVKPSDIPTFHYTAHLADVRWLRHAARRKNHG